MQLSGYTLCSEWLSLADGDIAQANIDELLSSVKDDLWVIAACTDRVLNTMHLQESLLNLGIERSKAAAERVRLATTSFTDANETEEGISFADQSPKLSGYLKENIEDAAMCFYRVNLLNRLDRLQTYNEIARLSTQLDTFKDSSSHAEELLDEDDPWLEAAENEVEDKSTGIINAASIPMGVSFEAFLTSDLPFICCTLAAQTDFNSLRIVLQRHQPQLFPYRFKIIEKIPDFADISSYSFCLPRVDTDTGMEMIIKGTAWRDVLDWVEEPRVLSLIEDSLKGSVYEPPEPSWDFSTTSVNGLLSSEAVTAWYTDRSNELISSGNVDGALELLQFGSSEGVSGLDELGEEITLISRFIYDVRRSKSLETPSFTLADWKAMDASTVISQYLSYSSSSSIVSDVRRLIFPYLSVLDSRYERMGEINHHSKSKMYLYDFILQSPLELVAPIFEASRADSPPSSQLITNMEDLTRLALTILYGRDDDNRSLQYHIFESLPAFDFDESPTGYEFHSVVINLASLLSPIDNRAMCNPSHLYSFFEPLSTGELSYLVDFLDFHLEASRILEKWGFSLPLHWFICNAQDTDKQRASAAKIVHDANKLSKKLKTSDDWLLLLDDMIKLTNQNGAPLIGAFKQLSPDEIRRIFFRGILRTGNFGIAKSLLNEAAGLINLSADVIEELCLTCSREFYNNADSGNYNFGEMKMAYDCLNVAPMSPLIKEERDFIEATSRLSSFNLLSRPGVLLSPAEIRLTKDKLGLIAKVLSSTENAYKYGDVLLELTRKLGYNDLTSEIKVLAMLADTALQVEDFEYNFHVVERMVTALGRDEQTLLLTPECTEACWMACYQLGKQPEFSDLEKKLYLLSQALRLCPPDWIVDIISVWKKLETTAGRSAPPGRPTTSIRGTAARAVSDSKPTDLRSLLASQKVTSRIDSTDIQRLAGSTLQKGLGWLIGADDE